MKVKNKNLKYVMKDLFAEMKFINRRIMSANKRKCLSSAFE